MKSLILLMIQVLIKIDHKRFVCIKYLKERHILNQKFFPLKGSQYDKYGNLENWWDEKTKALFNQRVKCFIDQYSSYNDSLAEMPVWVLFN